MLSDGGSIPPASTICHQANQYIFLSARRRSCLKPKTRAGAGPDAALRRNPLGLMARGKRE